jgi:hypothetical protein
MKFPAHCFSKLVLIFFLTTVPLLLVSQIRNLISDLEILKIIDRYRPLRGATIPADIKHRLGATHVGGKYFLSDEPYLIEGAKKLHELGFGVCKLWFYKQPSGYQYHSDWNLPVNVTLKQLAEHPYYQKAFDVPFSTFMLSTSADQINSMLKEDPEGLKKEEAEYYELTKYLLKRYKDREVNFILKNWEGDWILRGGVGQDAQWGRVAPPADLDLRLNRMKACFNARQTGVNRARKEVGGSKCKVYHAIEVNKVIDAMYGIPTVTTHILPYVAVDMVSWSAYDATDFDKTGLDLYKGIDFVRKQMKPAPNTGEKVVFIGEIGIPEMATKNLPEEFKLRWDTYTAVCLAQKIPYMVQWELYCNETARDVQPINQPAFTRNKADLNGFWLLKPDGTKGYAMQYFDWLLKNAGKKGK